MTTAPENQSEKIKTFLPAGVSAYLYRRLYELAGLALIGLGVMLLLTLLSYETNDPSFNSAGTNAIANNMGKIGAYIADLAYQTLGIAGYILVAIFWAWGGRLIFWHKLANAWLRIALLPILLWVFAVFLATLPTNSDWFLRSGYGGFIGDYSRNTSFNLIPGLSNVLIQIFATPFLLILLLYEMSFHPQQWWHGFRKIAKIASFPVKVAGLVQKSLYFMKSVFWGAKPSIPRNENAYPELGDMAEIDLEPTPPRQPITTPRPVIEDRLAPLEKTKLGKKAQAQKQRSLDLPTVEGEFILPNLELLQEHPAETGPIDKNQEMALEQNARMLEGVLEDFGIKGVIIKVRPGPVVTLYELEPAPGTKTSRVIGLADDIARSMSAISVRIATIPGRSVIGIELPNSQREMVDLRQLLESASYENSKAKLPMVVGKDIGGRPNVVDLATMPHLLIAGTTGSGKSVGLNAMILSLLYKKKPDACRFIMIDPKMLELSVYEDIPHLLTPVVTDPKKAVIALKWTVREMEDRYRAMSRMGVRNIDGFNKRMRDALAKGEDLSRTVQTGFDDETGEPIYEKQAISTEILPYIVVVVDEMADLMLVAGKDIEASIQRLAQMARAAGIHIILATQRPSVDVITGTIKANFPTRISFSVTSKIDSRTILGEQGAEQLLGKGDMLHMAGGGRITRIHGPFVADEEVEAVCNFLKAQGTPDYVQAVTDENDIEGGFETDVSGAREIGTNPQKSEGNELYDQAVALVAREGKASTSFVQRHLQIGYNRAARIVEQMEKEGVVSAANHVGKRTVLVGDHSHR